ncbi:MAG: lysylphosphatidylglycerol synthase transmembrane domain-containing protein, partial [Candidatus Woesearchaeota archaeon]
MNKKRVLLPLAFVIGIILFVYVLRRVGLPAIFDSFRTANLGWLIVFLIVSVAIVLSLIYRWKFILESQRIHLPLWKIAIFKLVGFSFSFLTPTGQLGGDPVRGILLKREKVPAAAAYSSVLIDKSIELATHIGFAVIGFVFIILNYHLTSNALFLLSTALAAAILLLVTFYYSIRKNKGFFSRAYRFFRLNQLLFLRKYEQHVRDVDVEIVNFFRFNKKYFRIALAISLLSWVFMFIEYEAALLAFNYSPTVLSLFLVICVVGFSYAIPVPAALGVLELSQASLFVVLNVPVQIGIALGLLIRFRDVLWAILGLVCYANYRYCSRKGIPFWLEYRARLLSRKIANITDNVLEWFCRFLKRAARRIEYRYLRR